MIKTLNKTLICSVAAFTLIATSNLKSYEYPLSSFEKIQRAEGITSLVAGGIIGYLAAWDYIFGSCFIPNSAPNMEAYVEALEIRFKNIQENLNKASNPQALTLLQKELMQFYRKEISKQSLLKKFVFTRTLPRLPFVMLDQEIDNHLIFLKIHNDKCRKKNLDNSELFNKIASLRQLLFEVQNTLELLPEFNIQTTEYHTYKASHCSMKLALAILLIVPTLVTNCSCA